MNTVCSQCLAINRLPEERIHEGAKCGRCSNALFSGEPVNATLQNFDKLLKDDLPIVIDFWAPWCNPCLSFSPTFSGTAQDFAQQVRFIKVNSENEPELSARFQIRSIPTLIIVKQGKVVNTVSGALPKAQFKAWLADNL